MVSSRTRPGSREMAALTASALTDATFVQVAGGALVEGRHLTLVDLAPTTIWILHGSPARVGHMATGTFLDMWWGTESGLTNCALRGVLGQADPDAQFLGAPVLRLRFPRISGSGIRYDVEVLNGVLPRVSGSCVLFLGPGDGEPTRPPVTAPAT